MTSKKDELILGKAVIKFAVMDEEMQQFAMDKGREALQVMFHEQQIAQYLKSNFERKYKSHWHVVVGKLHSRSPLGRNFGAFVTHEDKRYIYFYIGQKGFLIWSTPT